MPTSQVKLKKNRAVQRNTFIVDEISIILAFFFALAIRYRDVIRWREYNDGIYTTLIITVLLFYVIVFLAYDLRRPDIITMDPVDNFLRVLKGRAFLALIVILYFFLTQKSVMASRLFMGFFLVLNVIFGYVIRMIYRSYHIRRHGVPEPIKAYELVLTSSEDGLYQKIQDAINDVNDRQYDCVLLIPQENSDKSLALAQSELEKQGIRTFVSIKTSDYHLRSGIATNINDYVAIPSCVRSDRANIFGVNYCIARTEEAVYHVLNHLEELKSKYICFSNVHTTVMARENPDYRETLNDAAMVFPDGSPIAKLEARRGFEGAERVAGPDFMRNMFRDTMDGKVSHYFYGSSEETLNRLRENLLKRYPGINIKGMYSPPFRQLSDQEDEEDVRRINESGADIVWIGLGAPKQEKWMNSHQGRVNTVMMGVGAGFDFHAGTIQRAPIWLQKIGLEWLYRLLKDPARLFKRYIVTNTKFIVYLLKDSLFGAKTGQSKKTSEPHNELNIAMLGHKRVPSREGGVEVVVEELSTRMVELGYKVTLFNRKGHHVAGEEFDQKPINEYKGVKLVYVPTINKRGLAAATSSYFGALKAAFGPYDIVHFHAEGPCVAIWVPKLMGKRCVVTIHGLDHMRKKWGGFASKYILLGEKRAVKYADEIIVLSQNVQEYFKTTYNRNTIFIPNGVSCPELYEPNIIKTKYNLEKDSYFMFLGRLVPEKGIEYLIKAYKELNTDKKLVIAGSGSDTEEFVNEIHNLTANDDRIIFTGFVQGSELAELFSNCYTFVLPSDLEGMPMTLLEAMSYGRCCLVSDIPECASVVEDKAEIFKAADIEDLRKKMQQLNDNEDLVHEYQNNAADYICNKYSWDQVVQETLEIYHESSNS